MKRFFLAILIIALILLMCGCQNTPGGLGVNIHDDFIDPETGVHYLIVTYDLAYGFGIAPRYNTDGTLMVEE